MNHKRNIFFALILLSFFNLFSQNNTIFNKNLTENEKNILESGQLLIRKINYSKNICLNSTSDYSKKIVTEYKNLNPKYLAEVIQIRKVSENPDLPKKLLQTLYNIDNYSDIVYYSEHNNSYGKLYNSAKIINTEYYSDKTEITALINMDPFGNFHEKVDISEKSDEIIYLASNYDKLKYHGIFTCVGQNKFKISVLLIKDNDNWILYGIGGINAPLLPFVTERIRLSFNNRIKTFCDYIYKQF